MNDSVRHVPRDQLGETVVIHVPRDQLGETVVIHVPRDQLGETVVIHVPRDQLGETVASLRDEGYVSVLDVTAVDYLEHPGRTDLPPEVEPERFELVVTLISHAAPGRIRLRVQVPADDPTVATLFDLYPGTEALEREVADMFGIVFEGHPDPSRILMPPDWEGHPLRKDFSVGQIPVQFKATR